MTRPNSPVAPTGAPERLRRAEAALKRLGFARVASSKPGALAPPDFWVQEAGVPRRTFPVYLLAPAVRGVETTSRAPSGPDPLPSRAIVVVDGEGAAEQAWRSMREAAHDPAAEVSVLVLSPPAAPVEEAHWHLGTVPPRELLKLTTGIVVGLFQRAAHDEESAQIDFGEMLALLRQRFGVDVHRSLGVDSDEDALFLLYQLAQRDAYAPGESGSGLHALVLKPTGPAARLPWFAA